MKLLVCGGRDYSHQEKVFEALDYAHAKRPITLIIHGASADKDGKLRGADRWAEEWAISREIRYVGFPAKWTKHSKAAGPLRVDEMLTMKPDGVAAFPSEGPGTPMTIEKARKAGIEVWKPFG